MAIIALEEIEIRGFHGVNDFEKREGNRFWVDVRVETLGPLPDTDLIEDTLDYGNIYRIVEECFDGSVNLLETLVLRIGAKILTENPEAGTVTVRVSKLNPPIAGVAKRSFVEETFVRR